MKYLYPGLQGTHSTAQEERALLLSGLEGELPEKLGKYYEPGKDQINVMIGHICKGVSKRLTKIPKKQVQTRTIKKKLAMNGNEKAKQWVIMQLNVAVTLGQELRGKVHIDIFCSGKE
ncbi:MAG: hypothetical protein M1822_001202 [Bathelium mastoideum]|nr:MAG: hypothetical protein M1822_001202 [Bathelium mastoideum]